MATALVRELMIDARRRECQAATRTADDDLVGWREEGLLVGTSSGANVFAALRLAILLPRGSVVVTVCDGKLFQKKNALST